MPPPPDDIEFQRLNFNQIKSSLSPSLLVAGVAVGIGFQLFSSDYFFVSTLNKRQTPPLTTLQWCVDVLAWGEKRASGKVGNVFGLLGDPVSDSSVIQTSSPPPPSPTFRRRGKVRIGKALLLLLLLLHLTPTTCPLDVGDLQTDGLSPPIKTDFENVTRFQEDWNSLEKQVLQNDAMRKCNASDGLAPAY